MLRLDVIIELVFGQETHIAIVDEDRWRAPRGKSAAHHDGIGVGFETRHPAEYLRRHDHRESLQVLRCDISAGAAPPAGIESCAIDVIR